MIIYSMTVHVLKLRLTTKCRKIGMIKRYVTLNQAQRILQLLSTSYAYAITPQVPYKRVTLRTKENYDCEKKKKRTKEKEEKREKKTRMEMKEDESESTASQSVKGR